MQMTSAHPAAGTRRRLAFCLAAVAALASVTAAREQAVRLPKAVAAPDHALVILPSGAVKVYGWSNALGELGLGSIDSATHKVEGVDLPGITDAVDGAAAQEFSLVLRTNGTVVGWGSNTQGQIGVGGGPGGAVKPWDVLEPVPRPTAIPGLAHVRQLAAGAGYALAVLDDGTVRAWGSKLGPPERGDQRSRVAAPQQMIGLSGVKAVAAGMGFALALLEDGTVWAWGSNKYGQLGDEKISDSASPMKVGGLEGVVAIAAETTSALALLRDGTVRVWGGGSTDQHMFGGARGSSIREADTDQAWTAQPLQVPGLRNVTAIAAGGAAFALLADGTVRAWGYNGYCGMGAGHCTEYPHGLQTPKITGVVSVSAALNRTYFVTRDGTVSAAGGHLLKTYFRVPTPFVAADGTSKR